MSTCMYPKCAREVLRRGLCHSHYSYAAALVNKGKTSWDELLAQKKCLGTNGRGKRVTTWFLDFNNGEAKPENEQEAA